MTTERRYRILLVDDDPFVLEALVELFVDEYAILTAATGAQALERITRNVDIAAVVLDIKMASMDGVATYHQIKAILPLVPIIIHTGFPGEYREQQLEELLRPAAYVHKGTPPALLRLAVRNACRNASSHPNATDTTMVG